MCAGMCAGASRGDSQGAAPGASSGSGRGRCRRRSVGVPSDVTNVSPSGDNSKFKVLGFMLAEMHAGREKDVHMAHFSWSQEKVTKHVLGG